MENADQDEELPGQFTKEELDRKLSEAQERLDKYKGYRKYMEENNLSQLSLSDTDTKLMKTRTGFSVAHNVQTVVDSDTHAIVESRVTGNPTDYGELYETLRPIRDSLPDD
ncbi:MAG: DDE transposase, partial [Lachnospiraceae bacterium]|nr:DDE transposase [Lachnospiraceae bacterium]